MSQPPAPAGEESLRDLLGRVIDNFRTYLRAEIAVLKASAKDKVESLFPTVGILAAAMIVAQAAATVLVAGFGALLACWIGWPAGFAVAGLIGLGAAAALGWAGYKRVKDLLR